MDLLVGHLLGDYVFQKRVALGSIVAIVILMGCIYVITNTKTSGAYIGSSNGEVGYRWTRHRKDLKAGKHHSKHLQRAWDKYGLAAFHIKVLETVDSSELLQREQFYLDDRKANYPSRLNYNVCWVAGNCLGIKHSAERRRKGSLSHMGKKRTKKSIEKQVRTWTQRYGKPVSLRDPSGRVRSGIRNLRAFARDHGLTVVALRMVLSGRLRSHKGWTRPDRGKKTFSFISPDGEKIVGVENLKLFCEERGLAYKQMQKVHAGTHKSHRAWVKL